MKIGMVCYPTVGGSGIMATELGHELAQRGHEVHFITYDVPFRLRVDEPNIFFHEVEITHYDLFKYPDYALSLAVKIAAVAMERGLDILHVHYALPHATSAFLARQLMEGKKLPVVTTLHGTDITLVGRDPSFYRIVKFSIEQSDGITAVSHSLKKQTCCQFGIDKPIEVIYNFFIPKPALMGKKPLRHLFVSGKQKLLVHSSNFREVKRPEDLIHIFKRVRDAIDCRLLLVGTGSGLSAVRSLVNELKLQNDVVFLGKSLDIDPYIASSDLFLLPSSQESFGLAALESMAYGVPVVATDIGGLPELVEQGTSGWLSPVGDVERMAADALRLLTDDKEYSAFSSAAAKRAATLYSAEKVVPQYEAFYKAVL